jgi:DNA-binding NtrC family response regulator/tetratricopeptide (TPR) repeat protein
MVPISRERLEEPHINGGGSQDDTEPVSCVALISPSRSPKSARTRPSSGFGELDRLITTPGQDGLFYVESSPRRLDALARHVGRRARALRRRILWAGDPDTSDAWHDVAVRLDVIGCLDPLTASEAIMDQAGGAVLIIREGADALWGRYVAEQIACAGRERTCLVIVLTARAPVRTHAPIIKPGADLSRADTRLYWQAVTADPDEAIASIHSLEDIDGESPAPRPIRGDGRDRQTSVDAAGTSMLRRLKLTHQSWSALDSSKFGSTDTLGQLLDRGVLQIDCFERVTPASAPTSAHAAEQDDAPAVAKLLEMLAPDDPWAIMRAAELYNSAGDDAQADRAAEKALSAATDVTARADFWRRYMATINEHRSGEPGKRRLWAADLALRFGDVDRALELAHASAKLLGNTFAISWIRGSALCARGDFTTAEIALSEAFESAPDASARAKTAVRMAELRYQMGDFEGALRLADEGLMGADDVATRLGGRNVIGKVHIARAEWHDAKTHFAADAWEAERAGDRTSELRARLNRGIALMMLDQGEDARTILLGVVADGERYSEPHAVSWALYNLATAAHRRHDYAEALPRYAQALEVARRLHEKMPLANLLLAFAELQLNLNCLTEAHQALAFCRRACGSWMPAALISDYKIIDARIHLAAGRTAAASELVREATSNSASSRNGDSVSHCPRIVARIALEEGNQGRLDEALENARRVATTPEAFAEIALLEALRARAVGLPFEKTAMDALQLAQGLPGAELALEGNLLLAGYHLDHDAPAVAQRHVNAARALRARMTGALAAETFARFLGRRDQVELASIEARLREASKAPARVAEKSASPLVPATSCMDRILGHDPALAVLRTKILAFASTDTTVLILGENGTGKELVADALHEASDRRAGPFIKVNCAAFVETLLIDELFGHEKGAYSGAESLRLGCFELARGGTLFLDEIGDISPSAQKALLRVLEDGSFQRLGSTKTLRADCQIVCATNRNLEAMVEGGKFAMDLYHRLTRLVVSTPPLRDRLDDLPLLAEAFLHRPAPARSGSGKALSPEAIAGLRRHGWPGNIRELENALTTARLLARGEVIELDDITSNVAGLSYLADSTLAINKDPGPPGQPVPAPRELPTSLSPVDPLLFQHIYERIKSSCVSYREVESQLEEFCITRAFEESGGRITLAGKVLGILRGRMSQLVRQYGLAR